MASPGSVRTYLRTYLRRGPLTASFLAVLVAVQVVLGATGTFAAARSWSSTNVENLAGHPFGALVTSVFFLGNGAAVTPGTVLIAGCGIGAALWWVEARHGPATALAVFLGGHAGATAVTAAAVVAGVAAGRYPAAVLSAADVGISYGAQAAAAAAVVLLPRPAACAGALVVVAWPLLDADWIGAVPDFTTVGHLAAAALGFTAGALLRRRSRASTPRTGWSGSRW